MNKFRSIFQWCGNSVKDNWLKRTAKKYENLSKIRPIFIAVFYWNVIQIYPVSSRFIIINLCRAHTHTKINSILYDNREEKPFDGNPKLMHEDEQQQQTKKQTHSHICTMHKYHFHGNLYERISSAHYNKFYLLSSGNDFFIIYVLMRYYRKTTDSKRC